ncbi:PaaI family thioesterase [Actinomycetospora sp. NBRC 106378]|uniref:PaaI family thioesterase n=1 Tax=Actinomycetospora sp. NBRC 106378 TaxID=3032208 RepID=UPI0024A45BEA|nr:PaaI family thioesterase [Actinomycetospora sp. NBRC 106378]GLZ50887.1 thioesterase [Actinomycetospora sp. NBRC 106378]
MPASPTLELPADATTAVRHEKAPAVGERIPVHSTVCFGCADLPYGLRLESWVADDEAGAAAVRSRMVLRPDQQGAPGLLHGGLLTAAFDEVLGSVVALVTRPCVTARLETDFRAPMPIGSTLWLHGRVDGRAGRKLYVGGTAHLDAEDGPVVGTARALFLKVGMEHFLRNSRPEDLEALGVSAEQIRAARG